MPTIYAHCLLGDLARPHHTPEQRTLIDRYPDCYRFAQQGPDFFFYYLLSKDKRPVQFGTGLHHQTFADILTQIAAHHHHAPLSDAASAFLYGFAGHFTLDAHAHPYVNGLAGDDMPYHFAIEAAFDAYLLKANGHTPHRYKLTQCLPATRTVQDAAAELFASWIPEHVTADQVRTSVRLMRRLRGLMATPTPLRAKILTTGMKKLGLYKKHGTMLLLPDAPAPTPEQTEHNTTLSALHAKALAHYPAVLTMVDRVLAGDPPDPWLERDFE